MLYIQLHKTTQRKSRQQGESNDERKNETTTVHRLQRALQYLQRGVAYLSQLASAIPVKFTKPQLQPRNEMQWESGVQSGTVAPLSWLIKGGGSSTTWISSVPMHNFLHRTSMEPFHLRLSYRQGLPFARVQRSFERKPLALKRETVGLSIGYSWVFPFLGPRFCRNHNK